MSGHNGCLFVAWASILGRFTEETLSTFSLASKLEAIVLKPVESTDSKVRVINLQQHQIEFLSNELQKTQSQVESLLQLRSGEIESDSFIKKTNSKHKNSLSQYETLESTTPHALDETEQTIIRKALESTGDKTILIEKLINVLRLARQVQCTNSQLKDDISQMVSIIEDLNLQLYEKQLEIDQAQTNSSNSNCHLIFISIFELFWK